MNRSILNKVRSMLSESGLPKSFWAEAASSAVYQINRSPCSSLDFDVPEERWTGTKPRYDSMRVFGSIAYVHSDQGKLNPRAKKATFIGYPEGIKGYKLWLVEEKKCVITRDVVFHENMMYKHLNDETHTQTEGNSEQISLRYEINSGDFHDLGGAADIEVDNRDNVHAQDDETPEDDPEEEPENEGDDLQNYQLARDRQRRLRKIPARFCDSNSVCFDDDAVSGLTLMVTEDGGHPEPECYDEAMRDIDSEMWKSAMNEEMESLMKNQTWTLVKKPEKKKVIGCRWLYKRKPSSSPDERPRFKARLVAKGYLQKEGIDYQEIFSPVVKHVSIRLILSYVVNLDMELEQLDVKTAFLHGDLDEYILMEQPPGYRSVTGSSEVCLLRKSLYGLKQASRQWNQRFDGFMKKCGYARSMHDNCVYFRPLKDGTNIYLLIYVDDMLIAANDMKEIQELKAVLSSEFEMKDLGEAKRILGMEIHRDRAKGILKVTQKEYLKKVLRTYKMEESKGVSTPIGAHFKLKATAENDMEGEDQYMKDVPYSNAVGSIMYCMVSSRPDLAYPMCVVSRYMSRPSRVHWQAVKWILRYIKNTQDVGLVYKKQGNVEVSGFCDSDYAADLDKRRPVTGFVFTSGGNAISWKSNLQKVVALSTTEAEYMALTESVKEALWLKGMANELGFTQKNIEIFSDSQSAICLSKNSVHHERTKHIDVRLHFIRDKIADGEVVVKKVSTSWNPADVFTKTVTVGKLQNALELIRVCRG